MPTLHMKKFEVLSVKNHKNLYELKITLKNNEKEYKMGEQVYYGYPLEHSGRI